MKLVYIRSISFEGGKEKMSLLFEKWKRSKILSGNFKEITVSLDDRKLPELITLMEKLDKGNFSRNKRNQKDNGKF